MLQARAIAAVERHGQVVLQNVQAGYVYPHDFQMRNRFWRNCRDGSKIRTTTIRTVQPALIGPVLKLV